MKRPQSVLWMIVIVMSLWLFGGATTVSPADKTAVVTLSQLVIPVVCELSGVIVQSDGKTPLPEALVQVRDTKDDKVIYQTKADKNGAYKLPKFSPGNYGVLFAERVQVNIRVVRGKTPEMDLLNIAMPEGKLEKPDEIPRAVPPAGESSEGKK